MRTRRKRSSRSCPRSKRDRRTLWRAHAGRRLASASKDKAVRLWIGEESEGEYKERLAVAARDQASRNEQDQEWFAAAYHLRQLAKGEPSNAAFFDRLGDALAEQDEWPEAVAAYARARRVDSAKSGYWYAHGLSLLGAGDEAAYRDFCSAMLDEFSGTKDPKAARWLRCDREPSIQKSRSVHWIWRGWRWMPSQSTGVIM